MLGVLLQSLLQFPAVLADFYLSGLLEEGKVDGDPESDDDDFLYPLAQVQVRVQVQVGVSPLPPTPLSLGTPLRTLPIIIIIQLWCGSVWTPDRRPLPSKTAPPTSLPVRKVPLQYVITSLLGGRRGGGCKGEGAALQLHSCVLDTCGLLHTRCNKPVLILDLSHRRHKRAAVCVFVCMF